jgi:hypothetical protein
MTAHSNYHEDYMQKSITVLCANSDSYYFNIPDLDIWTAERDAYNYNGSNWIISHAPCQQWSQLRAFAKNNEYEKNLAWHCLELVERNGGIFEHPRGSFFFKVAGIDRNKIYSIDQSWFGFPARKTTYLYFNKCKPLSFPIKFEPPETTAQKMWSTERSKMTQSFAQWLVDCIKAAQSA